MDADKASLARINNSHVIGNDILWKRQIRDRDSGPRVSISVLTAHCSDKQKHFTLLPRHLANVLPWAGALLVFDGVPVTRVASRRMKLMSTKRCISDIATPAALLAQGQNGDVPAVVGRELGYDANSVSNALASFKSSVSNPSVNQL